MVEILIDFFVGIAGRIEGWVGLGLDDKKPGWVFLGKILKNIFRLQNFCQWAVQPKPRAPNFRGTPPLSSWRGFGLPRRQNKDTSAFIQIQPQAPQERADIAAGDESLIIRCVLGNKSRDDRFKRQPVCVQTVKNLQHLAFRSEASFGGELGFARPRQFSDRIPHLVIPHSRRWVRR